MSRSPITPQPWLEKAFIDFIHEEQLYLTHPLKQTDADILRKLLFVKFSREYNGAQMIEQQNILASLHPDHYLDKSSHWGISLAFIFQIYASKYTVYQKHQTVLQEYESALTSLIARTNARKRGQHKKALRKSTKQMNHGGETTIIDNLLTAICTSDQKAIDRHSKQITTNNLTATVQADIAQLNNLNKDSLDDYQSAIANFEWRIKQLKPLIDEQLQGKKTQVHPSIQRHLQLLSYEYTVEWNSGKPIECGLNLQSSKLIKAQATNVARSGYMTDIDRQLTPEQIQMLLNANINPDPLKWLGYDLTGFTIPESKPQQARIANNTSGLYARTSNGQTDEATTSQQSHHSPLDPEGNPKTDLPAATCS